MEDKITKLIEEKCKLMGECIEVIREREIHWEQTITVWTLLLMPWRINWEVFFLTEILVGYNFDEFQPKIHESISVFFVIFGKKKYAQLENTSDEYRTHLDILTN
jgi:hypothetical protein